MGICWQQKQKDVKLEYDGIISKITPKLYLIKNYLSVTAIWIVSTIMSLQTGDKYHEKNKVNEQLVLHWNINWKKIPIHFAIPHHGL